MGIIDWLIFGLLALAGTAGFDTCPVDADGQAVCFAPPPPVSAEERKKDNATDTKSRFVGDSRISNGF